MIGPGVCMSQAPLVLPDDASALKALVLQLQTELRIPPAKAA